MRQFLVMIGLMALLGGMAFHKTLPPWPVEPQDDGTPPQERPLITTLIPYDEFTAMMARRNKSDLPEFPSSPAWTKSKQSSNYALIAAQSPVKSQGRRGQCHNFTTTAAMEYAVWVGDGEYYDFSEQCNAWKFSLDYGCGNPPDNSSDGGWPSCEIKNVKNAFMKFEQDFPYRSDDPSSCRYEYNNLPYKQFSNLLKYTITKFDQFKQALDRNYVVAFSTYWPYQGWTAEGEYYYAAQYPACDVYTCGGHAILLVGYDDNYWGPGLGGFIFKNSWDTNWGFAKGYKPAGYGVLPYTFMNAYGMEAVAVSHKKVATYIPDSGGCSKK